MLIFLLLNLVGGESLGASYLQPFAVFKPDRQTWTLGGAVAQGTELHKRSSEFGPRPGHVTTTPPPPPVELGQLLGSSPRSGQRAHLPLLKVACSVSVK